MIAPVFAAGFVAISVAAGARCYDVRAADGGCLVQLPVAAEFKYGSLYGGFLANYFPHGTGVVVGAYWGGDVGTPLFRFARDQVRFAVRFSFDGGLVRHHDNRGEHFDYQAATFLLGPQLWLRLAPHAYLLFRAGFGGTTFVYDVFLNDVPNNDPTVSVTPTVEGRLGFAFDLF